MSVKIFRLLKIKMKIREQKKQFLLWGEMSKTMGLSIREALLPNTHRTLGLSPGAAKIELQLLLEARK